jgi:hypothetical protein
VVVDSEDVVDNFAEFTDLHDIIIEMRMKNSFASEEVNEAGNSLLYTSIFNRINIFKVRRWSSIFRCGLFQGRVELRLVRGGKLLRFIYGKLLWMN